MPRHPALLLAALLALAGAGPAAAQGARTTERRLPLNRDGVIKIFNYAGAVRVTGWARDSVAVTSTAPLPANFFMGGTASGVKLGLEGDGPGSRADLAVSVPAGARVWVRTTTADIEVTALTGSVDVGTVGGSVTVRAQPQQLTIESLTGAITAVASPAVLRLKGASAPITWSGSSEDATISTVEGAITARAGVVTRARVETVTGAVRYEGGLVRGGQLTLASHAGDVTAVLSRGATAEVELDAPTCDLLGRRTSAPVGDVRRPPVLGTLGAESFPSAHVLLRSFKGRATLSQP